jgi:SLOG cluster4 family
MVALPSVARRLPLTPGVRRTTRESAWGKDAFDHEATVVREQLPAGLRLAVIGSTSFWHPESEATCTALGRLLTSLDGLVLLTGGVEGVGEAVARSFHAAREAEGGGEPVFHLLPRGYRRWDYGETLFAGADMGERREILGRLAEIYVAIEGGPGTAHEASVALARSTFVIPVERSGGHSAHLYPQIPRPSFASDHDWRTLSSTDVSPEQVAAAVTDVVRGYLTGSKHGV